MVTTHHSPILSYLIPLRKSSLPPHYHYSKQQESNRTHLHITHIFYQKSYQVCFQVQKQFHRHRSEKGGDSKIMQKKKMLRLKKTFFIHQYYPTFIIHEKISV